ncbi:hypothetical protein JS531_02505 [Bifidobacterium sp. CP2]|uniref:hypothetical protein n=1 Tax=Bifidobacterium sp. CP2 TaxID=2809025 RepID=UPI001BDD0007|nr:hypothetical protein [Bifidobacterium sp. CP2]MBT1180861.1 hypothetical protein [Bifidobacterium sp. CP2]
MKKQFMAALAAIAAVLGFGFAADAALAADATYAPTIVTSGVRYNPTTGVLTVPIDADEAVAHDYTYVYAGYDKEQVSDVKFAANINTVKYVGHTDKGDFNLGLTLTKAARETAGTVKLQVFLTKDKVDASEVQGLADKYVVTADGSDYLDYRIPATGDGSDATTGAKIAKTGAALMPYMIAVALLAAAGIALFAVRAKGRHR